MVYVDIDGVLAEFDTTKSIEDVAAPGYSLKLKPIEPMCRVINRLSKEMPVTILSAVLHEQAKSDKREWLANFVSKKLADTAIFVDCGTSKGSVIETACCKHRYENILVDDFSKNLHEWPGIGIKVYNGINGTHGTWKGFNVRTGYDINWLITYCQLAGIIKTIQEEFK